MSLAELLDAVADGLLIAQADGTLVDVSRSLCEMTRLPRESLVGSRPPYPFWSPEHEPLLTAVFQTLLGGERTERDVVLRRSD